MTPSDDNLAYLTTIPETDIRQRVSDVIDKAAWQVSRNQLLVLTWMYRNVAANGHVCINMTRMKVDTGLRSPAQTISANAIRTAFQKVTDRCRCPADVGQHQCFRDLRAGWESSPIEALVSKTPVPRRIDGAPSPRPNPGPVVMNPQGQGYVHVAVAFLRERKLTLTAKVVYLCCLARCYDEQGEPTSEGRVRTEELLSECKISDPDFLEFARVSLLKNGYCTIAQDGDWIRFRLQIDARYRRDDER